MQQITNANKVEITKNIANISNYKSEINKNRVGISKNLVEIRKNEAVVEKNTNAISNNHDKIVKQTRDIGINQLSIEDNKVIINSLPGAYQTRLSKLSSIS